MSTRSHRTSILLRAEPQTVFDALCSPSSIRAWWGAARAIVMPEPGGIWCAAWGDDEDNPDYVTSAVFKVHEPPSRIVHGNYRYHSRFGPLPFEADFQTEFRIEQGPEGQSRLEVTQHGFPVVPEADEFFDACEKGWEQTLLSLQKFLDPG